MNNVSYLIMKAGPVFITNAEYKAMWGKIFAIPLGFIALIAVLSFLMEFLGTGYSADAGSNIKALEEYQHWLGNETFTYEGYVNGRQKLWIREKDGTITKV